MNFSVKIIHTIPSIADEASGGNYVAIKLTESLISQGPKVTLAALDWAKISNPPNFLKTFPLGWGPRRLGRSPAMKAWLFFQAASYSIDLIHNHSLWMMPNVYSGLAARRFNIPLIVSPHGTLCEWAMNSGSPIKKICWPLVQRPALVATTCFHATAMSEYEDIRRIGFRQPVAIIPNGIDVPESIPEKTGQTRTLLFLGRIHPKKGLDMLLPAWGAVQNRFPEWNLKIVGPDHGEYCGKMRRLAADLGLERVEFAGPLYGQEKILAYGEADLFVLPTYSENFGMSVAEALAVGTPAIVTKGAPWEGLVTHDCGWWIDVGVDPLVACLEESMNCPREDLSEKGQRGRAWMKAEFSWPEIGCKMAKTYQWILHGGQKPDWVIE